MNAELGKTNEAATHTPASEMGLDYIKQVTNLMTFCGIESISAQRYVCGAGSRLHVSIAPFSGIPEDIAASGIIVKDAIATLLSIANISRVLLKPSDEELMGLHQMWDQFSSAANQANSMSNSEEEGSSNITSEV